MLSKIAVDMDAWTRICSGAVGALQNRQFLERAAAMSTSSESEL
jgi:hypothetical protein